LYGPLAAISGLELSFRRAVATLALGGICGLDVSVDRARDDQVSPTCLMLINDRRALTVVTHPGHQILEARTPSGREPIAGCPEIVKMQTFSADRPHGVRPGRHLIEVAAPQRASDPICAIA